MSLSKKKLPQHPFGSGFVTRQEAAEMLCVAVETLDRWRREGRIPAPATTYKGRPLWRRSDLIKHLESLLELVEG